MAKKRTAKQKRFGAAHRKQVNLFDFAGSIEAVVVVDNRYERFDCFLVDYSYHSSGVIRKDFAVIKHNSPAGGGMTVSGTGTTLNGALGDYVRQIRGKTIAFGGLYKRMENCRQIEVPMGLVV